MPQLKTRAISQEALLKISTDLITELQALIGCPREYFTLECIQSTFIQDGQIVQGAPIVEIYLFDRGQEMQDTVAKIVTRYIQSAGYENVDVIFFPLERSRYYENGEHF